MSVFCEHDVVVVSISNTENKGGNAVSSTRLDERLLSFAELLFGWIVLLDPLLEGILLEHRFRSSRCLVDVGRRVCPQHNLDHSDLVSCCNAAVWLEQQIESFILPELF